MQPETVDNDTTDNPHVAIWHETPMVRSCVGEYMDIRILRGGDFGQRCGQRQVE